MTGQEILKEAERYNGFSIPEQDALAWINEALLRMGDLGLVYGVVEARMEPHISYELPPDAIHVVRVETFEGHPYEHYRLIGSQIVFSHAGDFRIIARKVPPKMDFLSEEPQVHVLYHPAIVMYVRGMAKLKDDEANQDGHRLVQMFEEESARVFSSLQRKRPPSVVKVER